MYGRKKRELHVESKRVEFACFSRENGREPPLESIVRFPLFEAAINIVCSLIAA
jgi:hypothetical protein